MGGSLSNLQKDLKAKGDQRRLDEMANERGIRFPGPNEVLTSLPDFDNAGDGMVYFSKLTPKQIKSVKDIPFRIAGRRQLSLMQRNELSPLSHDSLTKLETSNALQEVIRIAKSGGDGAEMLIGAKNGGTIPSLIRGQRARKGF